MANNAYMRMISVTGDWQPLSASPVVLNATIFIWSAYAVSTELQLRVAGGDMVKLPKSSNFTLEGVDLSQVEVKGETNYRVTVIGNTR